MNTKQQLHQLKLQQWAEQFREQASSGLTVKAWCERNNISIHTYNYWKHLLKQEYLESAISENHDIVPLNMTLPVSSVSPRQSLLPLSNSLPDSSNSISISTNDIVIQIGAAISEEHLLRILKAVRHA